MSTSAATGLRRRQGFCFRYTNTNETDSDEVCDTVVISVRLTLLTSGGRWVAASGGASANVTTP